MKIGIKFITALSLIIFTLSCVKEKNVTASMKIPLYTQCVESVVAYGEYIENGSKNSRYEYELEIEYFDDLSNAHLSIIGYIILSSYWHGKTEAGLSPVDSLEVIANSIKAECFPESRFTFDLNITSLSDIKGFIRNNGIGEHYLSLNGNELNIFFNDGNYNLPKIESGQPQ